MGFASALFNGVGTVLIIPILLELLGQATEIKRELPALLKHFLGLFDSVPDQYRLPVMAMAIVLMIVLKNASTYASALASGKLNRQLAAGLRRDGLRILLDVDLDYFSRTKAGDLINHLNAEVSRTTVAIRTLTRLATIVITISVFLVLLILASWQLTLISTLALGLVALANQTAVRRSKQFGERLSKLSRDYSSRIVEVLSGIRLVKATANEDFEYGVIDQLILDREIAEYESQLLFAGIGPINEVLSILALIAVATIGRLLFKSQLAAFSTVLLTYLFLLFRMLPYIGQLNAARSQFANSAPSVAIISDFLRRDDKPFMPQGHRQYTDLIEGIRFSHLYFKYPEHDEYVLRDIDLYLPKGTTLALVGSSGAGKSTMADLLPRFYDPAEGSIQIDGIDLREFNIKSFRKRLGIVSQDTFLFNATVHENLLYGRPTATEAEVIDAAKRANAYEFITRLPKGMNTMIGDRGVLLSGGQRQRLAIARALLQDPDILILDEATSALDTISERLVQKAIDQLSRDRTTLVIAHRLSTIQNADRIVVLEQGRVVEMGSHAELLQKGEYYAQLCAIQFSEQIKGEPVEETSSLEQAVTQTSYEMRSNLNNIIGALGLLADESLPNARERDEMTSTAYENAVNLLKSIEHFEKANKDLLKG
ncbi:ABC transporter ATP-binding protein [Vasconcelosia minhoensis]|uniref:ABC transporter ATP-binding protein n=1 Tax=Vasconcelosia minhoensis TaxID=3366354 RepID=UPI001D144144|nr:ABC transporter ATP-binding protein [Romeria gracilis]